MVSPRPHHLDTSNSLRSPTNPFDLAVSTKRPLSLISSVSIYHSFLCSLCTGMTQSLDCHNSRSRRFSATLSISRNTSVIERSERESTPLVMLGYSNKPNSLQKNVRVVWNAKFGGNLGADPTGTFECCHVNFTEEYSQPTQVLI